MFILILLLASICASSNSFVMRRSVDKGASAQGFLTFQFALSFLATSYLNGVYQNLETFSPRLAITGGVVGILMIISLGLLFQALRRGPPGLTFAYQQAGSALPPVALALLFGATYGFQLTAGSIIGLAAIIAGLYWGARQKDSPPISSKWKLLAIGCFLSQGLILTLFQWRCLLSHAEFPFHSLIPFQCDPSEDLWFMPGMFFMACIIQTALFILAERRWFFTSEIGYGIMGGVANGISTYLLLWATEIASTQERVILFPLFAMGTIILCNLWGQLLYKEHVNWPANGVCCAGILIAGLY